MSQLTISNIKEESSLTELNLSDQKQVQGGDGEFRIYTKAKLDRLSDSLSNSMKTSTSLEAGLELKFTW